MASNLKYFIPILKVAKALYHANVPFDFRNAMDGAQLRFDWCAGDIVCHNFSYGSNAGRVESYEFPWDNGDVSMLTPEEAAEKIIELYYQKTT